MIVIIIIFYILLLHLNILVNINIEYLNESIHSGSGIVTYSFNILRLLLDKLEDKNNSKVINQL